MVSVIIPAYNKASTIAATIRSVLRQTFQDFEIIVIDDGSTDDIRERLKEFGSRVRYFRQEKGGVSSARNRGIEESQGEFVAFLDGDDLWLPQKLEKQLESLRLRPERQAVQCSVHMVNDQLEVLRSLACSPREDRLLDFLLFKNLPGFGSTLLARKKLIQELGGFGTDLVILEDWDLACRLARRNLLFSVPDFLVLYRQHSGNRSRQVKIHVEPGFRSLSRLFSDAALPSEIRRSQAQIWARFYAMLAGGYVQNRQWKDGFYWATKALGTSPGVGVYFAGMPVRRLRRMVTARQKISFAHEFR